jgi:hypothetical protein
MKSSAEQKIRTDTGVWGAVLIGQVPKTGCGLINNADLEDITGPSDWTWSTYNRIAPLPYMTTPFYILRAGTADTHNGSYTGWIALYSTQDWTNWGTTVRQVTAGVSYKVSFWMRKCTYMKHVVSVDGTYKMTLPDEDTHVWKQFTFMFTAKSDTAALNFYSSSSWPNGCLRPLIPSRSPR